VGIAALSRQQWHNQQRQERTSRQQRGVYFWFFCVIIKSGEDCMPDSHSTMLIAMGFFSFQWINEPATLVCTSLYYNTENPKINFLPLPACALLPLLIMPLLPA